MDILALISLPILASIMGFALSMAARFFAVEKDPLVDSILDVLPNGQCGQCGFPGCTQAAVAMCEGNLGPDCCPPGGSALAEKLSVLLDVPLEKDPNAASLPQIVEISAERCDGCTRCFKKCPFDAIVGANKQLHGVLSDICTGCGLCTEVCPQDAFSYKTDPIFSTGWAWPKPELQ